MRLETPPVEEDKLSFHTAQIRAQAGCFRLVYDIKPRYVNDHCFIEAGGRLHLFHITGSAGGGPYDSGNEVTFGHAVTTDLLNWHALPDVLSVDPVSSFEPHHIFAPYVIRHQDRFYLFYAGINQVIQAEAMCLAVSDDLVSWHKHPFNPVFRPSYVWAEYNPGSGVWACCRDPHVIAHPQYGFILYYVSWIKNTRGNMAAIGAAISDNLVTWQDVGPVLVRERAWDHSTTSMESPCVVERDDQFYMFYKHRDETRLLISPDPLHFTDCQDKWFSPAHAAEVFSYHGGWYISSCSRDLLDVRHTWSDRTRGLYLASFVWADEVGSVRVEPFKYEGSKPVLD